MNNEKEQAKKIIEFLIDTHGGQGFEQLQNEVQKQVTGIDKDKAFIITKEILDNFISEGQLVKIEKPDLYFWSSRRIIGLH